MRASSPCPSKIHISRRQLLAYGFATGIASTFGRFAMAGENKILVSAASDKQSRHWAVCLQETGKLISKIQLPARAHEVIKHPTKDEIAIIGRRPGQYIKLASIASGKTIRQLQPASGYHFYGHALFTPDGRFLITTENHIDSGKGYIFIRDSEKGYQVTSQFPSHGIGPHEVKLCSDGDTLVVANGGILTHPDKGRAKLNLDTMSPSLTYLSLESGELLEEAKLDENYHQLSIRHMDINTRDEVLVAMQYQGDRTDHVPLVASHKRGKELKPLWAPETINYAMKHYCGSVCFDPSGNTAAISSPKGNLITFWDYEKLEFLSSIRSQDSCGLASYQNKTFLISNGRGQIVELDIRTNKLRKIRPSLDLDISWDNHLTIS